MTLPKILILGQPFNNVTGGGITLTNLFKGWDKDRIAVSCSPYLIDNNMNTKICDLCYQLGNNEHKLIFPFSLLKKNYKSGLVKYDEIRNTNFTKKRTRIRAKLIMNFLYPLLKFIGLSNFIVKIKLSKEFCSWLNSYKPDVIYAQASDREAMLFCISVYDYLRKPLVFHMMDDWLTYDTSSGLFKKYWQKKIDKEFRILISKTALLMSISEYMSQEYKKRYNRDSVVFHNPIDTGFWGKWQRTEYDLGPNPYILYAGRTGLGINKSLKKIAKAVQLINVRHGLSIKFRLQIAENPSWITKYSCVERNGFVSYNDLPKIFSKADILILPYDFSMESIKFVQYSMPTKAPEYMISGTPIIVFAPEDTAIVKYAKEFKWAKVITVNDSNELLKVIMELIQSKEERQKIGQIAKTVAQERHKATKVAKDFRKMICSL